MGVAMGADDDHAPLGPTPPPRHIPHSTLDQIRGILVSSLPRENLGPGQDDADDDDELLDDEYPVGPPPVAPARRVTFREQPVVALAPLAADRTRTPDRVPKDAAGATSDALNQRPNSANGGKPLPAAGKAAGKENAALQREREERLRILREKQTEERQRKLEELKQQALAAQKFREQKEEERRRRIEDMRQRDGDRRHQVEERKRQIHEAEQERRTAILRKKPGTRSKNRNEAKE